MNTPAPSPLQRLLDDIGRDASLLLDAHGEARNNLTRNEANFLRLNLLGCFRLAARIMRRRETAKRLLKKGGR